LYYSRLLQQVVEAFSEVKDIVRADGQVNRAALGPVVFGDKKEMKKLTDIVWPAIQKKLLALIAEQKQANPNAILCIEAAVLIESGWSTSVADRVWVVEVPVETAKTRLMARNNLSEVEVSVFWCIIYRLYCIAVLGSFLIFINVSHIFRMYRP
jgi:dephospho-CoA kinase